MLSMVLALVLCADARVQTDTNHLLQVDASLLQEGDLIFRRGQGVTSRAVLIYDRGAGFSHVGMVVHVDDNPKIIHITPGESLGGNDVVRRETLSEFLTVASPTAVTVRRASDNAIGREAARFATRYYEEAVPFDAGFSLSDSTRMYCTELVWRAYLAAGADLIDGHFNQVRFLHLQGKTILPSTLLQSKHLREVFTISH